MDCKNCGTKLLDCDCGQCHKCHPEELCEKFGMCHLDYWSSVNDSDYEPKAIGKNVVGL